MGKGKAEGKEGNDIKAPAGGVQYQFAIKPVEKPGWEGFKEFIWNTETSEFLGRTGISWLKITVFYIIYYALLAAFFIAMLLIFFQTLKNPDDDEAGPTWQNSNGIIGGNPGVGYRPKPPDSMVESTLITFKHAATKEAGTWDGWVDRLNTFLTQYKKTDEKKSKRSADETNMGVECSWDTLKDEDFKPGDRQYCKVDSSEFLTDNCTEANNYGYPQGTPCVLLKLNKIYGWNPKPYDKKKKLPENAPKSLKDFVTKWETDHADRVGHMVWLSCEGENPADVENIGEIKYFPYPGIPTYYFPFNNQKDYKSPIVMAHLTAPKKGVLIAIECKAWAQNIQHDETKMERIGSVHFELLVD
jgi:sodium/potassium-transporting ATPase subunit beta